MSCRCRDNKPNETWKFSVHSDANNQHVPEQEKGEMSEWSYSSSASDKILDHLDELSLQSQGWWDESSADVVKAHRQQQSEDDVDLSQLGFSDSLSWGDWSKHSNDCNCDPCNDRKSWISGPDESAKSDYANSDKVKEFKYSKDSDSSKSYPCDPCRKRRCDPCHDKRPCDPKKPVCVDTVCKYPTKCGFVRVEVHKSSEPSSFSGPRQTIQYQFKLINTGTDYIAYKAFLIDSQLGLKELCLLHLAPGAFETVTWDYITTEEDVNARKITNCAVLYVMVRKKTYLQSPPAKYSIPYVMPSPQ
jgi:hypothetical protein